MSQYLGLKPSGGRIVVCSVLALIIGLLQPLALMLQIMMPMPGICIAMILAVVFYAYAGKIPATVLCVSGALSSLWSLGIPLGAVSLLFWLVPAVLMICGVRKRDPFFQQMSRGIAVSVLLTAVVIALMALMFGSEMVATAIDQVRATFETQKDLLWEMFSPAFEGRITFEDFVQAYYEIFNRLQLYYEYHLLSNLMTGAALSALISIFWSNWLMARRGAATTESFRGLSEWYLSSNTTIGLILTLILSSVLAQLSVRGADTAWIVVSNLCSLAFIVQCLAALDRRMKRGGSASGRRAMMIVLLILLGAIAGQVLIVLSVFDLLAILGCLSALFGSRGAARPFINKIKDKMDGEDR